NDYEIYEMAVKDQFIWLKENSKKNAIIGYNPNLFSIETLKKFKEIAATNSCTLQETSSDLIDEIWQDKPIPAYSKAFEIKGVKNKLQNLCKKLKSDFLLETDPENICSI